MSKHIPRIYYDKDTAITNDCEVVLPDRWYNHLIKVFREHIGDDVIVFNEKYGEWLCNINTIEENTITVKCNKLLRSYTGNTNVSLAFCLVKYDNVKLIIEKCTELGITDFYPLINEYTQYSKLNTEKLHSIAIQASEQSERLDVPNIHDISTLNNFINNLPKDITWYSAVERMKCNNNITKNNVGFIVGPEGGFSSYEKIILSNKTMPISLSNNVLRTETACIACASLLVSV